MWAAPHIGETKGRGNAQLSKLKRFKNLDQTMKIHLYKALIRPILIYPAALTCVVSRNYIRKLQIVQNKAIRAITNRNPVLYRTISEEIHSKIEMETLNTRLYHLATKIWCKMETTHMNLAEVSTGLNRRGSYDQRWWPRLTTVLLDYEPAPIY